MRYTFLVAVSLSVASAAVIKHREPQLPPAEPTNIGPILAKILPKANVVKVDALEPQLRKSAKRTVARYGPLTLVGKGKPRPVTTMASLDPTGQSFLQIAPSGMCNDCTILAGKPTLVFEDGSPAGPKQGIYIHHILVHDLSKNPKAPVSKCTINDDGSSPKSARRPGADMELGAQLFALGEDSGDGQFYFTSKDGQYESGYFVGADDTFGFQADLVNYNNETQKVYLAVEIEYVDGQVGADAVSTLMSIIGCEPGDGRDGGTYIHLNQTGLAVTKSKKFPILADGTIVSARGHLHDGGEKMVMLINGQEVCESTPTYNTGGTSNRETIQGMSSCPNSIPVKKGDIMTMNAVYDLAKHPMRNGGSKSSLGMIDVMAMFSVTWAVNGSTK